ncbi:uncharacterized protein LOC115578107 isoform X3 [Sparus aurata]|uniref:uncharacterized protein LOC115578105 isoform X3 n=1 Tax=Sparus aurata TaxID=8175 RepID=UPI0011C195D0|nr:uncharacterized protein LOC115578105 isoform X3 [Sparus aurata]XP_030266802.1 uncharacterized protein LOC115578107 isoform X3 [Sparus aurata]XP_030266803.1 uncharacterized protein LOC115578107 isoform X3 [Sparus aurata]
MEVPDRRIVYCFRCKKGYDALPVHLKRVCMKDNTQAERDEELKQAKLSQKEWTKFGRRWEYKDLCSTVPDEASRQSLVHLLRSKGFFVVGEGAEGPQGAELSSQEKRSSEHQRLLDLAEDWMEEACHRLQTGERLSHHHITMYRYFCMATLLKRHGIAEKMVADFKLTEWYDRQLTPGIGATIRFKDGTQRAVISVDEDRWFSAYFTCFFLGSTGLPVANPRTDLHRLWKQSLSVPPLLHNTAVKTLPGDRSRAVRPSRPRRLRVPRPRGRPRPRGQLTRTKVRRQRKAHLMTDRRLS